ncbi:kinase [Hyphococcus luteus]|uniref:Kinase n=1 Tax=Hyphococcus luteus TaxID=2058213 RepID=A0A2S7K353_9PROT|nr:kinase [Marinicaulis flavus]PQA86925.1 kinase [Marinicaulis flavus]
MSSEASAPCIDALIAAGKLPDSYRILVDAYWRPLAVKIAGWRREKNRPIIVGVNGGQGSGKTTVCKFLEKCLLPEQGLAAVTVSLDDFYLPKTDRSELAKNTHPLFATRGAPGTHDVAEMGRILKALKAGVAVTMPVFDKSCDDRAPESEWRRIEYGPDIILFEGWCVGAAAQDEEALTAPVNRLEREEDADGVWRARVNERLASDYQTVFALIDYLVMLRAPDMETILENRREQERKLREGRPGAEGVMSDGQVARFVQFYERLTRHMLAEMPARADLVFDLEELRQRQGE